MQAKSALRRYRETLHNTGKLTQATEELSYHDALRALLLTLKPDAQLLHEPRRTVVGRPDFILLRNGAPAGYIEAEAYGVDLDRLTGHAKHQTDAFKKNLDNFLLTNFVSFQLYRGGECVKTASLNDEDATLDLLQKFLDAPPLPICSPHELAVQLARRTRQLKQILHATLEDQLKRPPNASLELRNLYRAFQETLLPDLQPEAFADLYAQTIAYGLFAARCQSAIASGGNQLHRFTRADAAQLIPHSNPFLRRLFQQLAAHDLEPELEWIADELAQLLQHTDMKAILADFGKRLAREDPIVHFYEDFLAQYDPELREIRGVYYTPEPVVNFIVRAVDDLLQREFNHKLGLASDGVTILDPACGTGSFLYEIIELISDPERVKAVYGSGNYQEYVHKRLLPRLFGFELLVAPYAVAHLKLALQLQQHRYTFQKDDRLGIYLTNTLEEAVRRSELLLGEYISQEANAAADIKRNKPILVVLGNPPYSGHSANRSVVEQVEFVNGRKRVRRTLTWIGKLLEDYKQVDGQPLGEKNPKWLQDDYVKFIRWGQWRIEKTGKGILAFITNHAYLDNPTFRGMRACLLKAFDQLYILNLHGNARRKERAPDGSPDENLFDIQQGVAILIAIKHETPPQDPHSPRLLYYDLWGSREAKYEFLNTHTLDSVPWTPLNPTAPMYLFVPHDTALEAEYQQGWRIPDIFPTHSVGIVTARDSLTIHWTRDDLWRTVCQFAKMEPEQARERFQLGKDVRDWSVANAQQDLRQAGVPNESAKAHIQPILYRPFDVRYTFYTGKSRGFHCMPRPEVMRHLLRGQNLALITVRSQSQQEDQWSKVFITRLINEGHFNSDINYTFPLYLYSEAEGQGNLLGSGDRVNLSEEFRHALAHALGSDAPPDPESTLAYIYALLHSNAYRSRYAEFLRRDFPRIPLPPSHEVFDQLAAYGQQLIQYHLLEHPDLEVPRCKFYGEGDGRVERVRYDDAQHQVWINSKQYFEPVPPEVWAFRVGGYAVSEKWLADRKGRTLSLDERLTYQRVITALTETIRLQAAIDTVCETAWGW